jgi:hypothetical protein
MKYSEVLFERGKEKLKEWKHRYSMNEYPRKVAINTVYELALLESSWPVLEEKCATGIKYFQSASAAHDFINETFVPNLISQVHGKAVGYLESRDAMPNLLLNPYRECLKAAIAGDRDQVRIIENTYLIHFTSIYMMYALASFGLTGMSRTDALIELGTSMRTGSMYDFESLYSCMNVSAQHASHDPIGIKAFALLLDYGHDITRD